MVEYFSYHNLLPLSVMTHPAIGTLFEQLGATLPLRSGGLAVTSPIDGAALAQLAMDNAESLDEKLLKARTAQKKWAALKRSEKIPFIEAFSAEIKRQNTILGQIITLEAGKTVKEGVGEADAAADVLVKTIKTITLPELNGMMRCKERSPVGLVGLITSFNFPLVVANWTLAPALLAANAVLWKPSEKTPLSALAAKGIFDAIMGTHCDLLQIIIGEHEIGGALVAHEQIDMISATGSVAMGRAIKTTLAAKKNHSVKPILELGGNNGVIISDKLSDEHLEWSLNSVLNSFLGTTGQRCTNTRRLIVHKAIYDKTISILTRKITDFTWDDYGYGPLIDAGAFTHFEKAKQQAVAEGGRIVMGERLKPENAAAYYVKPALALMPTHSNIMHEETFAPLLFITPYDGDIAHAIALLNAPSNAGLVSAIYTQSQREADQFAAQSQAGHSLINSPKGTGTPAFDMGFGGNKASGEGEILNAADPLRAFTRDDHYSRIAQNKEIVMDK